MFYEHKVRGKLPKDQFFSHHYGIDEDIMAEYSDENHRVNILKLKHITDPIPIVLMNGPTTDADYRWYKEFLC